MVKKGRQVSSDFRSDALGDGVPFCRVESGGGKIKNELKRIAHITRQSLGLYRESNAPTLTSINSVLDSTIDLLKGRIGSVAKTWKAVAGELRQVFSNLLANSLDAVEEGGTIQIRVSTGAGSQSKRQVRTVVADTGKGINPETQQRIFEPIFTTKETSGTGLGLWVVKQLIDKHSGILRLRSQSGVGSTGTVFAIFLPMELPSALKLRSHGAASRVLADSCAAVEG